MDDESSSLAVPVTVTLSNIRITELDVNKPFSFFAQIGTEQELACFDEYSASLSAWCDKQKLGVSELPLVGAYLAVWSNTTLREDKGWFRASVTKHVYNPSKQVECKLLDIGTTQLVKLSNVCNQSPPMMYSMAAQARLCTLSDAVKLPGTDAWSAKAISKFKELVIDEYIKQAVILSQQSDDWSLSIVIKMSNGWTSIGRLLAEDNLATFVSSQLVLQAIDTLNSQCPVHLPPAFLSLSSSDESSVHNSTVPSDASSDKQPRLATAASDDALPVIPSTISDTSDHPPLSQIMSDLTLLKDSDNESNNNSTSLSLSQSVDTDEHETVKVGEKAAKSVNVSVAAANVSKQKILRQPFKKMRGVIITEKPAQASTGVEDVVIKDKVKHHDEKQEDQASDSAVQVTKDETKQVHASTIHKEDTKEQALVNTASVVMKKDKEEQASIASCTKETVTAVKDSSQESNDDGFQADCDLSSSYSPSKDSGLFISQFEVEKERKRANLHACYTALMTETKTTENAPSVSQHKKSQSQGRKPMPANLSFPFPDDQYSTGNLSGRRTRRSRQGKWGKQQWNNLGRGWLTRERQAASADRPEYQQQAHFYQPSPPACSDVGYPVVPRAPPKQDLNNEVEWLSRIILTDTNKIVSAGFIPGQFMEKINRVLSGSPAQKLSALIGSSGPVQSVLKALILNAMKDASLMEPMVQTIVVLYDHLTKDVSACLQSVMEKESKEKHFCILLTKLYFTSLHTEALFPLVGAVVRHFLDTWVKCAPEADEQTSLADALLFAELCEAIGPTLDTSSKEILDEYFDNIVRENILQGLLPRSVREVLLDLTSRRITWIITGQQTGHDDKSACPPQSTAVEPSTPSHTSFQEASNKPALATQHLTYKGHSSDDSSRKTQSLPAHTSTQVYPLFRAQGYPTHITKNLPTYSDQTHHRAQAHRGTVTPPHSAQSLVTYSGPPHSTQDHSYHSAVTPSHGAQSMHSSIGSAQGSSIHTWAHHSPFVDQSLAYSAKSYSAQTPLCHRYAHSTRDYSQNVHDYSTGYRDQQSLPAQSYSLYNAPPSSPSTVSQPELIDCPQPNQAFVKTGSKPSYRKVTAMLQELNLLCFLEKFHTCLIKDRQLQASRDDLKSTLKEAGIPSGAVLAILQYLDQEESKTFSLAADQSQWPGSSQQWTSKH